MNPSLKQSYRCTCYHSRHDHDLPPPYSEHAPSSNQDHTETEILRHSDIKLRPLYQPISNDGTNTHLRPAQDTWTRTATEIDFPTMLMENLRLWVNSKRYWKDLDRLCEKRHPYALKVKRWRAEQGITRGSSAAERHNQESVKDGRKRGACREVAG
jgi:hypothetical protein